MDKLNSAISILSDRRKYHPIRDFLDKLVWDGIPRINSWIPLYMGAEDSVYTRAVSELVIMAAVKRAYYPGCKWDYVVIFEGAQGTGKSTSV